MRTSRRNMALAITLYAAACGADGWPPISAELLDLDGRIEYGFYASDAPIIEGALERLKQMPDSDEIVRYYKAFGAYRLAQLRVISQGTEVGALLDSCATETQALGNRPVVAAEAWILSAACAELAARRAPAQSGAPLRKFEQAVTRARELDASNPRLALIESRALSARRAGDAGDREAARARLEAAIAEFEARSSSAGAAGGDLPGTGRAPPGA
jgi:hypothetical protein